MKRWFGRFSSFLAPFGESLMPLILNDADLLRFRLTDAIGEHVCIHPSPLVVDKLLATFVMFDELPGLDR